MKMILQAIMLLSLLLSAAQAQQTGPVQPEHQAVNDKVEDSVFKRLTSVLALEQEGDMDKALGAAEAVFDRHDEDATTRLIYGRLLVKNGKAQQAIEVLQPLALAHRRDWRPWFWLGSARLLSGDLQLAKLNLDEALSREGQVAALWVQRAIVEQELGKPAAALNMLQVANVIEPDNADVLLNYGYASEHSGNIEAAVNAYKRFLRLSSAQARYGSVRGQILYRLSMISIKRKTQSGAVPPPQTSASAITRPEQK